ncbi:OmpA family protein [Mangrovihabitans endophyticus]|uniref:OmpA-like domain-containing protein n=1 Tax=Mangrovihabitans endophyticus TaxID=1751298 RepID=A0A8J3FS89_9ACTN|nr:OmpA family protein [Mangrovihabitans endophyticus]GGL15757.1 hypothetical protein GCM10012284_57980 [Mangrovihabitans endophyticus]
MPRSAAAGTAAIPGPTAIPGLAAVLGLAAILALTGLAGCTDSDGAGPASTARPPSASSAAGGGPSVAGGGPAATTPVEARAVDADGYAFTMTMLPLARSGDTVVLTVLTRLDRPADGSAAVSRIFSASQATAFDGARLVDEEAGRVYLVADEPDAGCVCTRALRLAAGATRPLQAAFTSVPADVTRLSVMLPYAGVFTDVPVVPAAAPAPPAEPDALGRDQQPLRLAGRPTSVAADLDAWTERLDVPLRTRRTSDSVDLNLDTDVLFRVDSAELTPAAGRALNAVVDDLRRAGPGPLAITGHTDSTGTEAHNKALSLARARTVAEALRADLGDGQWPKTVAGKGESQPAAPNDTAQGRRLNRRVTISYAAPDGGAPAPPSATVLPSTSAEAGSQVDLTLPLSRGTVRFTVRDARVRGRYLLLDLVVRNIGDKDATLLDVLGQSPFTVRDEFDPYARYGASGVRLLAGATASYGLDYEVAPGRHRCLCDRLLNRPLPPGHQRVLALWFPAPAAGVRLVAVDVQDTLRISGVFVG